jgi:hypothetical protein
MITPKQWFQIVSGINGGLITGAALLQTLFGQDISLKIVAVLGIIGIIINSVGAALSGVNSSAQDVATAAAAKTLSPDAQKLVLNAAGDVPGTQRVINPTLAADPATSTKVTAQ